MAAAPVRCPDCPGPERGGGGGTLPVPHLGIAVDEGDVLPGALRIVRELRPAWDTATVKTKVRGGDPAAAPPEPAAVPRRGRLGGAAEPGWGGVVGL